MKAFVTGATGFLGSHVARVLADQGADLRLLVRATSNLRNLQGLKAETATGDLRDAGSLEKAMSGCDTVFHVAADYRLWARDPWEMYRSNVEGTRAILEAARKNGVRRVVHTSSVATIGFTENGHPADEDSPVSLDDMIGHYKRSKFMAEQIALEAGRSGLHVVTVNPTTPVGEQDVKPTPTGRIVLDFLKRKFPAYVETGLNLVDVRECARGHVAALEKGKAGERYILGGENLTLKQILDKLAMITGLPSPTVKLPYVFAFAAGVVDEAITGRLLHREPRATVDTVRMGKKEDVREFGQSGARTGLENCAGRRCTPAGGRIGSGPTDMSKVAIVAALEREVRGLVRQWRVMEKEHAGRGFRFFENIDVVLVCGGVGAEAARRAAEAVIAIYAPGVVYSVGFAGALDPRLKVGDVVQPQSVVNAGDGSRVRLGRGKDVLVSFGAVAGPAQKAKLRESFAAQAVDMEAAAVARAAEARGVEFAVLKVVSDEFDFSFPAMERFVDSDGRFLEGRFALYAAVRPWLWLQVARMARNSSRASRALCDALRKIDQTPIPAVSDAREAVNHR